jgi:hypothetical protein
VKLMAWAALFHVAVAVLLFTAGRAQLAPKAVDRDGIVEAAAVDAVDYRGAAAALARTLREYGLRAWLAEGVPLHVRIISLCFAALGPLFGYGTLAAEPFNLACYLAVVGLAQALARETGGERAARVAAVAVALWPTFLLHTTQLLKDPLFIASALVPIFIVVTWLTRDYAPRHAALSAAAAIAATASLLLIRAKFAVVVVALVALGLALLVVRQLHMRRLLVWNLLCALVILAAAGALLWRSQRTFEKDKLVPSPVRGPEKSAPATSVRMTAVVAWSAVPPRSALDDAGAALGSVRSRYNLTNAAAGSAIDSGVELRGARDVLAYAPRAFAIGMWAPFPSMWFQPGRSVGAAGRAASGIETLAMYVLELFALAAVVLGRRRLASLLLLLVAAFGVTILGLVVSNVGTLYRFRYVFWILLIVLGVTGAEKAWALRRRALAVGIAFLALSCAHPGAGAKRIVVTNAIGWKVDAIYLSPADAPAWEENILGADALDDGQRVDIRFAGRAPAGRWDMRIDGRGFFAEWKQLDLSNVSAIRIRFTGNGTALAELDPVRR